MTPSPTPEEIRRRLAAFPADKVQPYPSAVLRAAPRDAAVLVPLLVRDGAWHVLFIHRAANAHDPHSGQVAFPGGQQEPGDPSPVATALRETEEELGLPPARVEVLGTLPPHCTVTHFCVTPVVGHVPWPLPLHPAPAEVSHTFTVPLDWLADPSHRETRARHPATGSLPVQTTFFAPYQGEIIWGATARMVLTLLQALGLLHNG